MKCLRGIYDTTLRVTSYRLRVSANYSASFRFHSLFPKSSGFQSQSISQNWIQNPWHMKLKHVSLSTKVKMCMEMARKTTDNVVRVFFTPLANDFLTGKHQSVNTTVQLFIFLMIVLYFDVI